MNFIHNSNAVHFTSKCSAFHLQMQCILVANAVHFKRKCGSFEYLFRNPFIINKLHPKIFYGKEL